MLTSPCAKALGPNKALAAQPNATAAIAPRAADQLIETSKAIADLRAAGATGWSRAACGARPHSDLSVNPECVCQESARPSPQNGIIPIRRGRGRRNAPGRETAPEGKVSGSARPDEGEPPRPANGAAMGARALIPVVTSRAEIRSSHVLGLGRRALNRGNPRVQR